MLRNIHDQDVLRAQKINEYKWNAGLHMTVTNPIGTTIIYDALLLTTVLAFTLIFIRFYFIY